MTSTSERIHSLPLPTPFAVGDINAYLIESSPLTLVDTGVRYPPGMEALENGLNGLGFRVEDLRQVIVTHAHLDHSGNSFDICRRSGATLYVHTLTPRRLHRDKEEEIHARRFLHECGVSQKTIDGMYEAFNAGKIFEPQGDFPENTITVSHGDRIELDDLTLTVLHTPGHSPDHICLVDRDAGVGFTGDHLLPHITPNPLLYFDPDNGYRRSSSLIQYISSLDTLEQNLPAKAFPGHGPIIDDVGGRIEENRVFIQKRKETFKKHFETQKNATIYDIAQLQFGKLDMMNIYLALSETVAYKDCLEHEGALAIR